MQLDDQATQSGFAELVGVSQQAIAAHIQSGHLPRGGTTRQWLLAYTERLRLEASGRVQNEARDRRDLAIARQAEAKAELDEREIHKQDGLILDLGSVAAAMADWALLAKNEFVSAVESVVAGIEDKHAISIDRRDVQREIEAALIAVGNYEIKPRAPGDEGQGDLETEADDFAD